MDGRICVFEQTKAGHAWSSGELPEQEVMLLTPSPGVGMAGVAFIRWIPWLGSQQLLSATVPPVVGSRLSPCAAGLSPFPFQLIITPS